MPDRYAAFLSYAHRYQPWVQVLQRNLETCLTAAQQPGRIFLDETDLASGRSWIAQLQAGLDRSDRLVLIVTPEALASPRVGDEWQSFLATRRDWNDRNLLIVQLVETPLPPFLAPIQFVDFREADEPKYRRGVQELVASLLGATDPRSLPTLPDGIEIPRPPDPGLPPGLRAQFLDWLAPLLGRRLYRLAIGSALRLEPERLNGQPSWACAASAALVWATGQEAPVTAALRILDTLRETLEEDEPERAVALEPLRRELQILQAKSPEEGLLTLWLRQVAADHERLMPYFQQQVESALLERVYVPLELRPKLGEEVARQGVTLLDSPSDLRAVLALARGEPPWVTGRWVLLGDPGAGKTTLLRHLTATLAREGGRPWVPLFESLPRLLRERDSLLDRVVRRLERTGQRGQGLAAALDRAGQEGRLLLLLDGLDEVPREDRDDAERLLRDFAVRWPVTPLVVTSRPIGYQRPGSDFRELTVLPLDRGRRRLFLARWFGRATGTLDEAGAERALAALDGPELRELAGNPLYITLMALLFEHGTEPHRNRTQLYDQVFALLFEGKHRPEGRPLEAREAVHAVLRHLALGMTAENRDAEPVSALEDRLYRPELDSLRDRLERVARWRGRLRQFLEDLAERTGILGPHDGPDADWRFWHRTFREALVAERLAEEYGEAEGRRALMNRARAITSDEDLSRWAESFALLAGRVKNADELVQALVQENRPLGLRALATAQSLRGETLRKILELSEDWTERREVYLRLPELVGEPRRVLELIDRLRRMTRNGNDLFFLDEAVQDTARRAPDFANEARALRARLYDHIPPPPEDLFRWVETPRDGRVSFWSEIPAGRFWMGSPEGEGHYAEHPRHEVVIARPFYCSVAPVTVAQYTAFDPEHRSFPWQGVSPGELRHFPAIGIFWYEAVSFCRWLEWALPGAQGVRLPMEEEWEYACRAGTESRYWSGNGEEDLARVAWYEDNSGDRTHRVGEKPANPFGLYDMHGNVWEWMLSVWTDGYEKHVGAVMHDPSTVDVEPAAREATYRSHIMRGGSYWYPASLLRSAHRTSREEGFASGNQGIRLVLPLSPGS